MIQNMRKSFQIVSKDVIRWFPGHMTKGLRQMQQKLRLVDCVIEVHDARIPLSGRNPEFRNTISGLKPHILVLNKDDLIDRKDFGNIAGRIKAHEGIDVVFTNCKDQQCKGIRKLMPMAKDLILNSNRYNRTDESDYTVMIIGVPNVGKSSLINVLRNRHLKKRAASAVGAVAGITRSVLTRIKISDDPLVYLLDTPGILTPRINNTEMGMKLALCSCLQDHLVGPDLIADYLLYWMNKNNRFDYVKLMGLSNPTDNIAEVLVSGAVMLNKYNRIREFNGNLVLKPDIETSAHYLLKAFRSGELGKVNLDKDSFKY